MRKALLVTYSRTGTCRELARTLAAQSGWPVAEITETENRLGPGGYLRCLLDSYQRRRPAIRYTGPAPELFDVLVLLSPIWAWHLAAPMRSFVALHATHIAQYAVVSVMGGSGARQAESELAALTGKLPIYKAAFTARSVLDRSADARLPELVAAIADRGSPDASTAGHDFTHHPA